MSTGLLVLSDIHARLIDSLNHNAAVCARDIGLASLKNMILVLTGTGHPNHAIHTFNRCTMFSAVQVQHLARMKE
jgi:hypothetical protein